MFSLTPLFMATGFPFSYSTPDSPPSPDIPSILSLSSSSICACVFRGLVCDLVSMSCFDCSVGFRVLISDCLILAALVLQVHLLYSESYFAVGLSI